MSSQRKFIKLILFVCTLIIVYSCNPTNKSAIKLKVAINSGPEGEALRTLAQKYSAEEIEIIEFPYSTLREQLMSTLNSKKSEFDVVMLDDPWFPQLASFLLPINNVPDSILNDIVPASLKLCKIPYDNGELRALPFVGNTQLLFYRKDIAKRLGIKNIPSNWQEIESLVTQITNKNQVVDNKKVYGYAIRGRAGAPIVTDFLPIYWSLGGKLVDNRGNPTREEIDTIIFKKALTIYNDLKKNSPPGATNYDWTEMTAAFTNGQAIFELNWPAGIPTIDGTLKAQNKKNSWDILLPPGSDSIVGTSMIGNWLISIPKSSKNQLAAKDFLIWLIKNQAQVASAGNPPTRISIYKKMASNPDQAYFNIILDALNRSTPRIRSEHWTEVEDIISRAVSGFIVGKMTDDEATKLVKDELSKIFSNN